MVPLQVSNSLKDSSELIKLKAIRKLIIGGGKIDSGLMYQMKVLSNEIYATYGMSETATHIALKKINANYADNHYECLNGVTITTDEDQCLVIKASHISKEEIRTNDLVKIYSPKQFEILGRKDNIINSGGLKIIPEEVESKIASLVPYNIMISSLSDKELGEKIILLVESKEKNLNKLYALWKDLEDTLDKYEIPKRIEFLDSFIYTENGKINRKETRSLVKEIE
jgi:O-succinylbenzoic acid--CoA ligase